MVFLGGFGWFCVLVCWRLHWLRHHNFQTGGGDGSTRVGGLNWEDWEATGGSFSLPQDDVDESADERQREGNPGQDVGVAEAALAREPVRTHHRVDDGATHHKQTGKNLEDTGDEETSTFLQSEELAEEEEEGETAEDDGEDHQRLDRLDPFSSGRRHAVGLSDGGGAVEPQVRAAALIGRPHADDGGDEEQHQSCDMKQDDSQEQQQHLGAQADISTQRLDGSASGGEKLPLVLLGPLVPLDRKSVV